MKADIRRKARAMSARSERTLLAVKECCVELVRMFEAIAALDDDTEEYDAAMEALWNAEERICHRVMTLLPAEFPDGRLYRDD